MEQTVGERLNVRRIKKGGKRKMNSGKQNIGERRVESRESSGRKRGKTNTL